MTASSTLTCEACKQGPVQETIESYCPQHPFRLCSACSHRLRTFTLRPLEWFNLAATHTFQEYYLHDDSYRDDGTATQFMEKVVSPEEFPAPNLDQARQNPESLLDYAISRWYLKDNVIRVLESHEKKDVLVETLKRRVSDSMNPNIEERAYEICACLGPSAGYWIHERWHHYHPHTIGSLIKATAKCLPVPEGFPLALQALEKVPPLELFEIASSLAHFRSPKTLNWIEEHASLPFFEQLSRLAASSNLSWKRACEWLERGRPLSLIAVFALRACWNYNTPLLRTLRPKLLEPESTEVMTKTLEHYATIDPMIRHSIPDVISHWEEICGTKK
jgi:hypothetical protein